MRIVIPSIRSIDIARADIEESSVDEAFEIFHYTDSMDHFNFAPSDRTDAS